MKKKRNEVIQKINTKMLCTCYPIGGCGVCTCTEIRGSGKGYPTATAVGHLDADECAKVYYSLEKNPNS